MIDELPRPSPARADARNELAALIDPWLRHMRWRADFDDWRHKRLHSENYQSETLAQVTGAAGALAGRHVLDLGCGMGGFAVAAGRAGAYVTALDYNPAYCVITAVRAARYELPLAVVRGAGEALPLPAATYDIVTAWDVIEHVQQPEQMIAEIARVLRPGACAFVTVINRFAFRDPHYHLPLLNYLPRPVAELLIRLYGRSKRDAAFHDRQRLHEMHYFTFGGFRRLAGSYGFTVIDLDEERIRRGDLAPKRPRRRAMLRILRRSGMVLPLYRLYRTLYQGTYRLLLIGGRESGVRGRETGDFALRMEG